MKINDIKDYETGNSCFGDILRVNGKDYDDLDQSDVIEFIQEMFISDLNSSVLIRETFEIALQFLEFDLTVSDDHHCDQCGDWNYYNKYSK